MNSEALICISRQELELGRLSVREANELLRVGFLLPTDECWTDANAERRTLAELATLPSGTRPGWLKRAKTSVITKTGVVIEQAGQLTEKVSGSIRGGRSLLGKIASKVLDDYVPSLRGMVAAQLQKTAQTTKTALGDEGFLRKLFGAVYDCLPKPVYRFVSEQAFIDYCLKHRQKLLP